MSMFIDKWANWTSNKPSGNIIKSNLIGLPAPNSSVDATSTLPAESAPNLGAIAAVPKTPSPAVPTNQYGGASTNNTGEAPYIKASQAGENELLLSMMYEGNAVKNILNMRPR